MKSKIFGVKGRNRAKLIIKLKRKGLLGELKPEKGEIEFLIIGREDLKASMRNRIRRRLKSALLQLNNLGRIKDKVLVFRLNPNWEKMDWSRFLTEIESIII